MATTANDSREWFAELEKKVTSVAAEMAELRKKNRSLVAKVQRLERKARDDQGQAWEAEKVQIRGRVERLTSSLEALLGE